MAKEDNDGVDRGEVELSILWKFNPDIFEEERLQAKKDDKNIMKQMGKGLSGIGNFITGNVKDEDMDEAEDVTFFI